MDEQVADKLALAKALGWSVHSYPDDGKTKFELLFRHLEGGFFDFDTEAEAWAAVPDDILQAEVDHVHSYLEFCLFTELEEFLDTWSNDAKNYEAQKSELLTDYNTALTSLGLPAAEQLPPATNTRIVEQTIEQIAMIIERFKKDVDA